MSNFLFQQIGVISSPYKEKFSIPRQPGLVEDGKGKLRLFPPYNQQEAVRGLTGFSHLWILFVFHETLQQGWRPTVRPPRLGGNSRMGVFATRSPFRPNAIGLSLVELLSVDHSNNELILELGSVDLVDGTPVLDIKPYLPFIESHPEAKAGFAQEPPQAILSVYFTEQAEQQLQLYLPRYPRLRRFITQLLAQDPRPAYQQKEQTSRHYAVHLLEFNIHWRVINQQIEVFDLEER